MTLKVDKEARPFRFFPEQPPSLKQRVFLLAASRSSTVLSDWGTSADKGRTVTVEIDGEPDGKPIGG